MTTTPKPSAPAKPAPQCGPDCVYMDGACRCYYGATRSRPAQVGRQHRRPVLLRWRHAGWPACC